MLWPKLRLMHRTTEHRFFFGSLSVCLYFFVVSTRAFLLKYFSLSDFIVASWNGRCIQIAVWYRYSLYFNLYAMYFIMVSSLNSSNCIMIHTTAAANGTIGFASCKYFSAFPHNNLYMWHQEVYTQFLSTNRKISRWDSWGQSTLNYNVIKIETNMAIKFNAQ